MIMIPSLIVIVVFYLTSREEEDEEGEENIGEEELLKELQERIGNCYGLTPLNYFCVRN